MTDGKPVVHHRDLRVHQLAFRCAMEIFEHSKRWPVEEKHSLVSQIRRSSRSVSANIAEAWRKRRYVPHFISKLSDADAESAETQVWLHFAYECGYLDPTTCAQVTQDYDQVCATLVKMMNNPDPWCGPSCVREDVPPYREAVAE